MIGLGRRVPALVLVTRRRGRVLLKERMARVRQAAVGILYFLFKIWSHYRVESVLVGFVMILTFFDEEDPSSLLPDSVSRRFLFPDFAVPFTTSKNLI